ncbi:MAG: GMC family oxidoreductase N-terminal domain-containing protein, partial [Actinomycetota bacterium]
AHRLVELGVPVRLLDAGPSAPGGVIVRAAGNTMYRRMDYGRHHSDRLANPATDKVTWISSQSLGGLSNYWTSAVPRFAPEDFTEGERLDTRYRWPVGYDDLAPAYDRAEGHLQVTAGPSMLGLPDNRAAHRHDPPSDWQELADRCAANGEGLGAIPMAKGRPWMVAKRGTEFNSYHCVLAPIESNPLLDLRVDATVTRLIWSPADSRVTGVEYRDGTTGDVVTTPARAVVLAAGTVDSTAILLRSTSSDFPDGLGNTNGVLGRYLHDHPREWWPADLERPMRALHHPMYLVRRDHDRSEPLLATSHTVGLIQPRQRLRTYVRAKTSQIGVQVFGTMVPDPDFTVSLEDDPNRERPTLRLSYDSAAVRTVEESRERFRQVLGQA